MQNDKNDEYNALAHEIRSTITEILNSFELTNRSLDQKTFNEYLGQEGLEICNDIFTSLDKLNIYLQQVKDKYIAQSYQKIAPLLSIIHNLVDAWRTNIHDLIEPNIRAGYLRNIYFEIDKLIAEINLIRIDSSLDIVEQSANFAKDKVHEIKENIGLSDNTDLLVIYKNEAENTGKKILVLNIVIISIFILSLFTMICLVIKNIVPNSYIDYLKYSPLIITFFLFLTYLIKERNRHIEHERYCKVFFLELTALPSFIRELSDEQKNEIRNRLADKYFCGQENGSKVIKDSSEVNSIMSQQLKHLHDIKNLMNK